MCFATACTEELIKERVKILGRTKGLARLKAVGADTLVSAVAMNLSSRPYGNVEDMITPHQTPKFEYSGEEVDALSRKYMEQWLVWLVVDAITVGLYLYKGIPLTAGLYTLYCALAVAGYLRWRRQVATNL